MTPAPEVKLMRVKGTGETIEVQRVNGKWVERSKVDAQTPIVEGRADITERVNADAGVSDEPEAPKASAEEPEPTMQAGVLSERAAKYAGEGGADFLRGVGRGVTSEFDDELVAYLSSRGGDVTPRTTERGNPRAPAMSKDASRDALQAEQLEQARGDKAAAQERSPVMTAAGRGTGMAAQAMALGAAAPVRGLDLAGRAALGVMGATTMAGLDAAGSSEKPGMQAAPEASDAARKASMVSMGIPAAGRAVGEATGALKHSKLAQELGEYLSREGKSNRAAAAGFYGGELKKVGKQRGQDIDVRVGDAMERHGADVRPESGRLPRGTPMSSAAYSRPAEPTRPL